MSDAPEQRWALNLDSAALRNRIIANVADLADAGAIQMDVGIARAGAAWLADVLIADFAASSDGFSSETSTEQTDATAPSANSVDLHAIAPAAIAAFLEEARRAQRWWKPGLSLPNLTKDALTVVLSKLGEHELPEVNADALNDEVLTVAQDFESQVRSSAASTSALAMELDMFSQELVMAASDTASAVSETSGTVQTADDSVITMADSASDLSNAIGGIREEIEQSFRVTQRATEEAEQAKGMVTALESAGKQIGEAMGLIRTIAGQTNLLALNATIEAARAGEAGRGFAVGAGEGKALATQTADATDTIANQIATVQEAAANAAKTITSVVAVISEITEIGRSVGDRLHAQSEATQSIIDTSQSARNLTQSAATRLNTLSSTTQQASETTASITDMVAQLTREADQLERKIETFLRTLSQKANSEVKAA